MSTAAAKHQPTKRQIRRWRQYLADERAEAILGALYDWAEAIVPEQ